MKPSAGHLVPLLIVAAWTALCALAACYSHHYSPDAAIIFEGAYRILCGQIPFRDFFMPVPPAVFYLTAWGMALGGAHWWSLAGVSAVLAVVLGLALYRCIRPMVGTTGAVLMACASAYTFLGHTALPWYTTTAFFFFLCNVYYLVSRPFGAALSLRDGVVSGVCVVGSLCAKQDVGLLHAAGAAVYLFCFAGTPRRGAWWAYAGTLLALCAAVAGYFHVASHGLIWRYLNIGLPLFRTRFLSTSFVWKMPPGHFALALLLAWLGLRGYAHDVAGRRALGAAWWVLLVSFVVTSTSSQGEQSVLQGMIFVLAVVWHGTASLPRVRKAGPFLAVLLVAATLPLAGRYAGRALGTWLPQDSRLTVMVRGVCRIPEEMRFPSGVFAPSLIWKQGYADYLRLEEFIRAEGGDFMAYGEYPFLYAQCGTPPPRGVFLWLEKWVSYWPGDEPLIWETFARVRPRLIVITDDLLPYAPDELLARFAALGYERVAVLRTSGVMRIHQDAHIWVMRRISLTHEGSRSKLEATR